MYFTLRYSSQVHREQQQAGSCQHQGVSYLESGYLVRVARLLVYMCPPTSMCTGALDLVS